MDVQAFSPSNQVLTREGGFSRLLTMLGKTPAEVSIAGARSVHRTETLAIFAFRVDGIDGPRLLQGLFDARGGTGAGRTLGGRSVAFIGTSEDDASYAYLHGDALYLIDANRSGPTDRDAELALAEAALAKLP
jgi:hypothetical protein